MMLGSFYSAIGKRKTSVARVLLCKGVGLLVFNGFYMFEYFKCSLGARMLINEVLALFNFYNFNIYVTLFGGGFMGQAYAFRLAICRCLCIYDSRFLRVFNLMGVLSYDSRVVERKKIGFVKARKRKQYSKR